MVEKIDTAALQSIVVVINNDEDKTVIEKAVSLISDVTAYYYYDTKQLMSTNYYKRADVFIVSLEDRGCDGRELYLKQRERFRIVPFLFIVNRPITDDDWDFLYDDNVKDLFDYLQKPLSVKKLRHRLSLMLNIVHMYNEHQMNTLDGLRDYWKDTVIRDREMIKKMQQFYKEGK